MAITGMNCPNCGAAVDFAGSTRANCSFCKSQLYLTDAGVKATSALNDLMENQPVTLGVDRDRIQQLVREGKKIEAIKLVREQTDLSLKEAKDAVEAIERGEQPELTPHTPAVPHGVPGSPGYAPPRQRASRLGCLFGCLPALLFIGVCAGFIMLSSQVMFRAFGPLDQALQIINSDPAVVQAFGKPITPGPFVTGKISGGDTSSSARFGVPIYGPRRSGDLQVSGSWRKGLWDLSIYVVYDEDGEEQTIQLTQKVK
jgi:hypothetical protein